MTTELRAGESPGQVSASRVLGLVLVAIVGCEFMLQLDATIVAVALPGLQSDLGLSPGALSWVINGFVLPFGGVLLLGGRLGDLFGHRTVFLAGTLLLAAASLLAGLAPNFGWLIAGRALQGIAAALAGPAGLALLSTTFTGERQQRAFAVYSTVTGLAAAAGMILGGVLTWAADWRWTLLVNAPIGLLIALLGVRTITPGEKPAGRASLDLPGALLSIVGMTAVVYGFVRVADHGWRNTVALSSLIAGVIVLALFVLLEARTAAPMLPLRVFSHRARAGAFLNLALLAFVLTGFLFFLAQFLQRVLHLDPLVTGLAFLPFGLALLVTARSAPKLLTKVEPKVLALIGLALITAATLWLSRVNANSEYLTAVLGPIIILGFGAGAAIVPFNIIILSETPAEDAGITSGVLQASLSVGGALGLAVLLTLFAGEGSHVASGVSHVFTGAAVTAGAAILVSLAAWFIPSQTLVAR
ncbi:DHA2 family efflux MFS transporter permease subunit [Planotetraspora sp. GP83]|uniref:DHA2 family efflux MFS transporter permease subunit n=1 Tax=Planotetraspora sp. GP83 TaxID=3156264 RepID=UPI0035119AA8